MPDEHVLVVDDDADAAEIAAIICRREGCGATVCHTIAEALAELRSASPTVVILDLSLPDGDGVEVLHELKDLDPKPSVILVSGFDDRVLATVRRLAETLGVRIVDDLSKPVSLDRFRQTLARALSSNRSIAGEDLERAIANDQLTLAYQPKVDLAASDFAAAPAVEALVRWHHPHYGDIAPFQLIPLAERSGLMHSLTYAVLRTALRQMQAWAGTGIFPTVAINLAPAVLDDRTLPDRASALAREHQVDPKKLVFEVTETAATSDLGLVMDIASRFRLQGMGLSIDDFGTGYSSIRQLYLLPFNELKIDISFVSEMRHREQARTLVKASIDLAHNLGMTACAEGVEDFETLSLLNEMGCDAVQGYFISRPLLPERLDILMRGWRNPFASSIQQERAGSRSSGGVVSKA